MDLSILKSGDLTPEQRKIVKQAIADQLQAGMSYNGVRDVNGKPIAKYAFLKKKHIKRIKFLKVLQMSDGRKMYVRIF